MNPSPESIALLLDFEGLDQPALRPPGASGITIGHGYDLGYVTRAEFDRDWAQHLPVAHMNRLRDAVGLKAAAAERVKTRFKDIAIPAHAAATVFRNATLPKWLGITSKAFPGIEKAHPHIQGALLSLTFNRGSEMAGPRRREMALIREAVKSGEWAEIPALFRSMKRLWPDIRGLRRRRDAEAAIVEKGLSAA